MFSWTRMLRKLFCDPFYTQGQYGSLRFGLPREQLKARRPRPTVKLQLEGLTERILPSASPIGVGAMSPMVTTAVEQEIHLISILQNGVSNIYKTIGQEVAQELVSIRQQLDRLLGIIPNAQNQSLGNSVKQPGSGSSSGSGATTTAHNPPNKQLNSGTQKAGSSIKPLDGDPATDTLIWKPQSSDDAASAGNWYDEAQFKNGVTTPSATNPVIFDGNVSNSAIEWTGDASAASIKLQGGYNSLMTIDAGKTVTVAGTLVQATGDPTANTLDLQFNDANSKFQIDGGGTITNMQLGGSYQAWFVLNGGTMNIAYDDAPDTYSDKIGVNISVGEYAFLMDGGGNSLTFANNSVQISVVGDMYVHYGTTTKPLIDNGGKSNDYINVNGGTLAYDGNGGVVDKFTVPVYVQGGGTFLMTEAIGANPGGQLIVQDGSNYKFPNGDKESVYMGGSDWSSSVELNDEDTLECDDDYYQDGGTLETMDDTTCTLQDGPQSRGTALIAGGSLAINPFPGDFGNMVVNGMLDFAGIYVAQINGDGSDCDLLTVDGAMEIEQSAATLQIVVNGDLQAGNTWTIIDAGNQLNPFLYNNEAKYGLHETTTDPVDFYVLSF